MCALTGLLLTDLDFSASELKETDELLFEGTQEDYQAWVWSFLSYVFWYFVLLWCPDAKIISSFISTLLCFKSYIQTKTIIDVYLLCENETSGCLMLHGARIWLIYYNVKYSWKRFFSSWVFIGHRHVPILRILGSGVWHDFVSIRASFILIPHHIKTIIFTYKKKHL